MPTNQIFARIFDEKNNDFCNENINYNNKYFNLIDNFQRFQK